MKRKKIKKLSWIEVIFSPYILALIIAVVIILFLPDVFDRYETKLISSGRSEKENSFELYRDLDHDGFSEYIVAFHNKIGEAALKVMDNNGTNMDQWNLKGHFPEQKGYLRFGDMNSDGIEEIYAFTLKNDSLFMHAIAPYTEEVLIFRNKLVTTIDYRGDTIHAFIGGSGAFQDLNNDGYKEMIFTVKAGFSLQPRGVYAFDNFNDTIFHSIMVGANMGRIIVDDLNDDGNPEIYCACQTLGNIHDSLDIPYSDYSAYLMAFDHKLNMIYEPVEYDVYPSSAFITPFIHSGKGAIALFFRNRSISDDPSEIIVIGYGGEMLDQKEFSFKSPSTFEGKSIEKVSRDDSTILLALTGPEDITLLDERLEIKKEIEITGAARIRYKVDLDLDGNDEFVFDERDNKILILQSDFDYPHYIYVPRNPFNVNMFFISIKKNGDEPPELFIKSDNTVYLYKYEGNWLYYMKYPLWLGIYLIILSILLLIRHVQKLQLERKMEIENRINALHLKTIKSQMDPHFMLNALNSISDNILNKQHEIAYRYLVKYSKLIRMLFTRADRLAITLEEELSFVEQYLELEQFRLKDKFTYEIQISPEVNKETPMPRMLMQLFVENAIKHGIRNKDGQGHIDIKAWQDNGTLAMTIKDDGIGRQAARKINNGYGKGLKIIDEMIGLFEKVNGALIRFTIHDLDPDQDKDSGTIVKVEIPREGY